MEGWQKMLIAAGSAAGLAAVMYYLFREEVELADEDKEKSAGNSSSSKSARAGGERSGDISLADIKVILQEMVESQLKMKASMKALSKKMAKETLSFEEIYTQVKDAQPEDPLEKRGLSMADLQDPISKHQNDPDVMRTMQLLMGPDPSSMASPSEKAKSITTEQITEINAFMLTELQSFIKEFQGITGKATYDMKTVVTATQAILDSKVTAKFNVESEDMEGAIMANQSNLVQNQEFLTTHMKIQQTMDELMQSF